MHVHAILSTLVSSESKVDEAVSVHTHNIATGDIHRGFELLKFEWLTITNVIITNSCSVRRLWSKDLNKDYGEARLSAPWLVVTASRADVAGRQHQQPGGRAARGAAARAQPGKPASHPPDGIGKQQNKQDLTRTSKRQQNNAAAAAAHNHKLLLYHSRK